MKASTIFFTPLLLILIFTSALHANGKGLERYARSSAVELLKGYQGGHGLNLAVIDSSDAPDKYTGKIKNIAEEQVFRDRRFTLVDRGSLKEIIREQTLQMTGVISQGAISEIGKVAGADLILSINKNNSEIEMRIVSVESGETLAYTSFSIEKFMEKRKPSKVKYKTVKVKYRAKKVNYNPNYKRRSPVGAAFLSLFPFYSGSWNSQWNGGGMVWVSLKLGSWLPLVYFGYEREMSILDAGKSRKMLYRLYSLEGYLDPALFNNLLVYQYGKYFRARSGQNHAFKNFDTWLTYCFLGWAGATVIDIIYSSIYVAVMNRKYAGNSMHNGSLYAMTSFRLRYSSTESGNEYLNHHTIDGVEVSFLYRFQ